MVVSIVYPCLNEADSIEDAIKEVKHVFYGTGIPLEIIVVDNGSTDDSIKISKKNGAKIYEERKKGYGNVLKKGFDMAKGEIIVMLDADGTYDPNVVPEMVSLILKGEADFVIGNRLGGTIDKGAMPWLHRRIGNPFLTFVLNKIYSMSIKDAHCGLRVFKKDLLDLINLQTPGMEFASEMLIKLSLIDNISLEQRKMHYRVRRGGSPHLRSFRDGWRHLKFLIDNRNLRSERYQYTPKIPRISL